MIARRDVPGVVLFSGETELTQTAYEEFMLFGLGEKVSEIAIQAIPELPKADEYGVLILDHVQTKAAFAVLNRKATRDANRIAERDEELRDMEILVNAGFEANAVHMSGLRAWLSDACDDHARTTALVQEIIHHFAMSRLETEQTKEN